MKKIAAYLQQCNFKLQTLKRTEYHGFLKIKSF